MKLELARVRHRRATRAPCTAEAAPYLAVIHVCRQPRPRTAAALPGEHPRAADSGAHWHSQPHNRNHNHRHRPPPGLFTAAAPPDAGRAGATAAARGALGNVVFPGPPLLSCAPGRTTIRSGPRGGRWVVAPPSVSASVGGRTTLPGGPRQAYFLRLPAYSAHLAGAAGAQGRLPLTPAGPEGSCRCCPTARAVPSSEP